MLRIDRHGSIVNQEKHDLFKPMLTDGTKKKSHPFFKLPKELFKVDKMFQMACNQ